MLSLLLLLHDVMHVQVQLVTRVLTAAALVVVNLRQDRRHVGRDAVQGSLAYSNIGGHKKQQRSVLDNDVRRDAVQGSLTYSNQWGAEKSNGKDVNLCEGATRGGNETHRQAKQQRSALNDSLPHHEPLFHNT